MLLNALRRTERRTGRSRTSVAAWAGCLAHLLHFLHVAEPLRCRIESIVRVLFEEIQGLLVDDCLTIEGSTRTHQVGGDIVLERESKSGLGGGLVYRVSLSSRGTIAHSALAELATVISQIRRVVGTVLTVVDLSWQPCWQSRVG